MIDNCHCGEPLRFSLTGYYECKNHGAAWIEPFFIPVIVKIESEEEETERYKNINKEQRYTNTKASKIRYERMIVATPKWANKDAIKAYYDLADRASEETGIKHHVDHIIPIKNSLVCGLHCESNLRVIPSRENLSKRNKF